MKKINLKIANHLSNHIYIRLEDNHYEMIN